MEGIYTIATNLDCLSVTDYDEVITYAFNWIIDVEPTYALKQLYIMAMLSVIRPST